MEEGGVVKCTVGAEWGDSGRRPSVFIIVLPWFFLDLAGKEKPGDTATKRPHLLVKSTAPGATVDFLADRAGGSTIGRVTNVTDRVLPIICMPNHRILKR